MKSLNLFAGSKMLLVFSLIISSFSSVSAQISPSLVCPDAADVNCTQDLPMATFADLEGSGHTADLTFSDDVVSGNGCDIRIARTYSATFTYIDYSYTNVCTVVHRVADFQAPVFIDAPGDATYECIDEVPSPSALSAQDECGGAVEVSLFKNASSINDTLVCNNITTPNAVGPDYALWLNGINAVGLPTRYAWSGSPSLVFSANGEARLVGNVYATNGSGYGWHVDITLADGENWATWSANGGLPHLPPAGNLHHRWTYYKLSAVISRLEGLGALAGSRLTLTHQPLDYSYGFQFGQGANSMSAANGGSGWFYYSGNVNRQNISGNGDVFLDMGCAQPNQRNVLCSQTIERRWAAVDNCGNAAYHTQMITVEDRTAPVFTNCPANVIVQCAAVEPAMVDASTLVALDNCDGPVTVTFFSSDTTGTIPCNYTITYTYEASDVCDNRSSCSYSVTVHDDVAPVIATPFDYTVECIEDVFFEAATATDNCSNSVFVAEMVDTAAIACFITYTRTFYAMDDCGNESSSTQTIIVRDTTNPILEVPADAEFQCNEDVVFAPAAAQDNCTDNLTIIEFVDTLNNGVDCEYMYIRTFTVTDDCGNTTIGVQTIRVIDTIDPQFTNLAGPYRLECDQVYNQEWTHPAATDNCDSELTYRYRDDIRSGGCLGSIFRTVTVSDNCGNSTTQSFMMYIVDTTVPEFVSVPADMTIECSDGPMVPNPTAVIAVDNCGDASGQTAYSVYTDGGNNNVAISVEVDTIPGLCEGSYSITWTWTATDYCENESTAVTTITVVDTTAPEFISTPQNITIDCSQPLPSADLAFASDNCTSNPILAIASDVTVSGNCANSYSVERTYVATDDCGNSAEFVQYIYVQDQVDPIFNAENESVYNYPVGASIPVIQPSAVDNCDPVLDFSYVDAAFGQNCNQGITRTWTAADDCGRTSTFVQTISIADTEAPQIFGNLEISRPCSDWGMLDPSIYATDNQSNNVQVVILSDEIVAGSCAGSVIRTLIAADDCGNVDTVEQVITLIDNFAPVAISEPVTITIECSEEINAYEPLWSDNCSGTWTTNMTSETLGFGCSFQIIETYSATDPCGNTGYTTRTINVIDTTAPQLQGVPENVTIDCNDAIPAVALVTATDYCDTNVNITVQETTFPGNCPQNYSIERMYIATDWCGNADTAMQIINIQDTTAPIFNADNASFFDYTCPVVAIGQPAPVVTPEVVEDCGQVTLTYTDVESGTDCNRSIIRTWVAADNCSNASEFVQNITISDLKGPVFTGPDNVSAPCDNYGGIINVTAMDNCSGVVEVVVAAESISGSGCSRVVTRTYSATDACGNTSTFVQTIQLTDDIAPSVTNPPVAVTRDCNQVIPIYTPQWTDNCDGSLTTDFDETAFTIGCTTVITRAYTATDDCGNSTTVNYVVTLVDTTAPTASNVTPNFTAECSQFSGVESVANPVFTDNCGSPITVTESSTEVASGCDRIITITWTAADQCGNVGTASTVVTLVDNSNPIFTFVPAGGTFSCEQGIDFGQATATDACNDVTVTSSDASSSVCENSYTITRTWTATDACGNASNAYSYYTVVDNTAPYFVSVPDTLVLGCNVELANLPETSATADDNCDNDVEVTYADILVSADNCDREYLRVFTATDNCGNSTTATQVIFSSDNEEPTFAGAADIDVACSDFTEGGVYVTAEDNCGSVSITVFGGDLELSSNDCKTIQRQYVAFDNCGNDAYFTQIIHIIDTEAPVASEVAPNVQYSCNQTWEPATVTFSDNCDPNLVVSSNVQTLDQGCTVLYAFAWTATDACGNSTTVSQLVTIVDDIAPVIADASSEQTVSCGTVVEFATPTATDQCAGDVPVTVAVETVGDDCSRTITTTFRAEDGCGNSSEVTHIVHYVDEAGPVWSAGNQVNFTYECGTTPGVSQPIATDNCNSITYSYVDGEQFSAGEGCLTALNRTWTATDACGNNSVAFVQTITFVDTTEPVLNGCPSDLVLDCTAEVPAAALVTATDNCDYNVTVELTETINGTVTNGSNLYTPVRPAGNSCNFPYDWAMALFSLPSQYRWYQLDANTPATMVDNGDGSLTISGRLFNVVRPDGGFNFNVTYGEGLNWADWSALSNPNGFKADCGGEAINHPSWMYYILRSSSAAELTGWGRFAGSSIHLTHAPSNEYFGFQVGDGANNYNGDNGAGGWFLYGGDGDMFLENGETILSGNFAQQGIGDFAFRVEDCPGYSIIRTWTAVDCEGNESTCSQTITFASLDNNVAGNPDTLCNGLAPGTPCDDGNACTEMDMLIFDCTCQGTYVGDNDNDGICNTEDPCNGLPELTTTPQDITVQCSAEIPVYDPGFYSLDQSELTLSITTAQEIIGCTQILTETYTATNACGESNEVTRIITIVDTTAPVCSVFESAITVECSDVIPEFVPTWQDNCDSDLLLSKYTTTVAESCSTVVTEVYTATDDCGNSTSVSRTITIVDTTAPVFTFVPSGGTYSCINAVPLEYPEVADNCGAAGLEYVEDYIETETEIALIRTWSSTDACGNVSTAVVVYTLTLGAPGSACNDNNPCTVNDKVTDDCSCVGSLSLPAVGEVTAFACSSYSWNGSVYNTSGDYEYYTPAASGCDSLTVLHLTVGQPTFENNTVSACNSYPWNGSTYTQSGTYTYVTTNASGCPNTATLDLTILPTVVPTFNSAGPYCQGANIPALPTTSTNGISGGWSTAMNNQSTTTYTFTPNGNQCATSTTLTVTINTPSTAPTAAVASSSSVNAGTAVTLSVSGGSLGTGAQWKWYRGSCGGTFLGTGASITVAPSATETYFVRAEGTCNTTACASVTVNVISAPCGPEAVSASAIRICQGSSTTLSVVGTLYPGAIWRWRKNSCTGTIVGTGASLSVSPTANTTYYVRAEGGTCGVTVCLEITIIVDKIPATPSVISGQTSGLCNAQNVTYSVTPVSTVQQYNWTVPPGITIVSGQGTASVTVNVSNFINTNPTNGNPAICVTAQNTCGNSQIRCLSLTTFPNTPASISGPAQPCINTVNTYSCPAVYGASSYTWLVPTGWVIQSGQGTSSITVLCNGTGGSVRVRTTNACGTSGLRSTTVSPIVCGSTAMPMQLELWPNPTSERVFFAHGEAQPDYMQIYDMLGRDIYTGNWLPEFDVSGLASGIYFVRATSGGESVVKRMEVVR